MRARSSWWWRLRRRLARATRTLARVIEGPSPIYCYEVAYIDAFSETAKTGTGVPSTGAPGLQVQIPVPDGATGCRIYLSQDVGFW